MGEKSEFYRFSAQALNGGEVDMEEFRGKTVLVVNTASHCGFTPQFDGLEQLYQKYKQENLVVLGFPCNQFGSQESGNADEIESTCRINYGVTFPMFEKIEVNGNNAHPIFKFLKNKLGGWFGNSIKWNFTKFLIDSKGKPIKRFAPTETPEKIDNYLQNHFKK